MADTVVIREFLVALGFKVDEKGLKNFREGVDDATKGVVRLIGTISGAALTVGAGVAAFASKLERLYFVAQRTGASATSLRAFEFAAKNMGVSAEAATGTIENLARFLRNNPAGEGYLASLGVQTRNANGELRDTVDIMSDLGSALAKKPTWIASQYGNILGIDENLMLAMRNGDFSKFLTQYREMSKSTGLDKAADDSHRFMTQLRGLGTTFENLGIRVEAAMLQKIGPHLDRFQRWMDDHGAEIANRIADIASAVLKAAEVMGPPLAAIADQFIALDKATDGWSTKLLFLAGVFKVLGGFQIIGGIWKMVAALRAMGAASAAASAAGSAGGVGGLLGRLLPWAGRLAGGIGLLFHSEDLNEGERQTLDQRQPKAGQQWSPDMANARQAPSQSPSVWQRLADSAFGRLISRGEGDYNSVNRGQRGGYRAGTENIEGMTLAQVMAAQRAGQFNAAGRYQIIGSTLADAARALKLGGDEVFDRQLQDRIFRDYLVRDKRRAIADYIEGRSDDLRAALRAASREWASVADPETGRSYYAGTGNNRASISAAEMEAALRNTRATYQQPAGVAAQSAHAGTQRIEVNQNTEIHVAGTSDPSATGRAVEREQRAVNGDMVRNLQGVIA
ncbi:mannosyl-glycoprotein endo-beta-N-acetylglucosamidase [Burkholderia sp. Ac-20384]|uniref:mannosyl-glycoprotein endo-beta-N-acetylglucosamidase n=1 Tax=Burkholderia sp. Ac-20384 TaxID=2703902 RepID=UPI00198057A2|nr:mannosyl-glycoprotein endo-beta-N-acetylglucosamidase [Burkholderia sp. Ac-20384]MBN3822354.1 mannosyl-glycoprotein endo-beta-N-acetylglucosamidase [Burkholderia sp. Ac-20384]